MLNSQIGLNRRINTNSADRDTELNKLSLRINSAILNGKIENDTILFSFKGKITSSSILMQIVELKLNRFCPTLKTKKKVYQVAVECLQNLYHHADMESQNSVDFIVIKDENKYIVLAGNIIASEKVSMLKNRIDSLNAMTELQLKDHYKMVLSKGRISSKGGAGLGLIELARKSDQKLIYHFKPVDKNNHFFTLIVEISL